MIEGDGAYTVADAVREFGTASIAFSGRVSSASGLQLTSMGRTVDLDGDKMSVWRIRNATEKELTVVLQPASGGTALTLVVAPKSDTFVNSADFGTQVLVYNGSRVDVKAAGTQAFSYSQAYGTTIDGEDLLSAELAMMSSGDGVETMTLMGDPGVTALTVGRATTFWLVARGATSSSAGLALTVPITSTPRKVSSSTCHPARARVEMPREIIYPVSRISQAPMPVTC